MRAIRKLLDGKSLFPFDLVYRELRKQETELPEHFHDHYEFVYIHEGKGIFFIDYMWYEKQKGDLFLIPGNTIHHALPDSEDPIFSTAVFFAPYLFNTIPEGLHYSFLSCFEYAKKNKQYKIVLSQQQQLSIEDALSNMNVEWTEQAIDYQGAIWLILCQLLHQFNRTIKKGSTMQGVIPQYSPGWMITALKKIDEHPEYDFSLQQLSKEACVSQSHFSRVFRQLTTMNLTSYINAKRLVKAKQLLLDNNLIIDEIAEQCGFQTVTHFYRVFKQMTGVTPRQYVTTISVGK